MVANLRSYKPMVIAAAAFLLAVQVLAIARNARPAYQGQSEFRRLYLAGSSLRTGHLKQLECNKIQNNSSDSQNLLAEPLTFNRLAYESLLFVPLSLLKYQSAYLIFFVLNLGLLAICLRLLLPYFANFKQVWSWMAPIPFFLFLPVNFALIQGADSILLFVLLTAAATSFYRERNFLAGIFLGLAIFKFQFVIPIVLMFALWRRWNMLMGFLVSAGAAIIASVGMMGVAGFRCYALFVVSRFAPISKCTNGAGITAEIPNLRCFLTLLFGAYLPPSLLLGLIAISSTVLILWAGTRTSNFALAIMIAVLVSYQGSISDAVLLILPAAFVLDARLAIFAEWRRTLSRDIVALIFVLPSLLYLVGRSYGLLVLLLLPTLVPLRYTSTDVITE